MYMTSEPAVVFLGMLVVLLLVLLVSARRCRDNNKVGYTQHL